MKTLIFLSLIASACSGQKLGKNKYGTVDTIHLYNDAEIIIYKSGSAVRHDTIWFNKQTGDVLIKEVDVVVKYSENLRSPFKFN